MVKNKKILLLSFITVVLISQSITFGQEVRVYHEFKPQTEADQINHTLYKLANGFFVYEDWWQINEKNQRCLFGVLKDKENFQTVFRSKGEGDSYCLDLSFFMTSQKDDPIIILGEVGAEYSWGVRVFFMNKTEITDAGFLNVGIDAKEGIIETVHSVIPYTQITTNGNLFKFTFTKDVIYENENFDSIKKEGIYYTYEKGIFKETIIK